MTRIVLSAALVAAGVLTASVAHAQSSVTLWGQMDVGINYVSNQGGTRNFMMDDGVNGPDLLGLRGVEDLGGGTKAIFELVDQFSVDTGEFTADQSLFSRTSLVGLQNDRFGKLTVGNQYEFMTDTLFFNGDDPSELSGHFYDFRAGPFQKLDLPGNPTGSFDWDMMSGGTPVTNSVKYVSPRFGGFNFGAMYAFGNVAGSVGAGNAQSFSLSYKAASFGADAAYTNIKTYTAGSPQISVRRWGAGAHYDFGNWRTNALFTTVHNSENGGSVWEVTAGAEYHFTSAFKMGASYMYMKGNQTVDNNHANQLSGIAEYSLSKNTSVYAMALYQIANKGAQAQLSGQNTTEDASSSNVQTVARIGIRHRF
ncbi:MAG: porin [Paraburkholderia tropica]|uniref:Porin n=1 Tax=Paraburkholderia tropica TaxID=92647 RepID=A0AAQ1GFR9_9BURK|nr:porin [Paraburkholderia tropica]MBB3000568.1 putative porin [Paraburkholderia tropica]MBB6320197.1 putative porin [Paraburkholderia tropica]PXX16908.1 putative porin [Paraburkholderia tropica]PZW83949.1 putative porin [Paraburkholderia tropica]QNB15845.1 porin [Paraburkholderia tropica]